MVDVGGTAIGDGAFEGLLERGIHFAEFIGSEAAVGGAEAFVDGDAIVIEGRLQGSLDCEFLVAGIESPIDELRE